MPDTLRQQLVDAVIARMQGITIAQGYQTDLGLDVRDWDVRIQATEDDAADLADDAPCLIVADLDSEPDPRDLDEGATLATVTIQLRIIGTKQPASWYRSAIGDVQQAVKSDRTWGELAITTRPGRDGFIIPQEAFSIAGAAVEIQVDYITQTFNPFE